MKTWMISFIFLINSKCNIRKTSQPHQYRFILFRYTFFLIRMEFIVFVRHFSSASDGKIYQKESDFLYLKKWKSSKKSKMAVKQILLL